MIKLKPCPFCGGEAEVERRGTSRQSCIIACTECGCRHEGPDEYGQCGYQWNIRVADRAHAAKTIAEEAELTAAQELDQVKAERDAASDYAQDQAAAMDLVAKALGVPDEPHQGRAERILEAAESAISGRDEARACADNWRANATQWSRDWHQLKDERNEALHKGRQAFDDLRRVEKERDALKGQVEQLAQQLSEADNEVAVTREAEQGLREELEEVVSENYFLAEREKRWRAAYTKLTNAEQTQDADTHEFMHLATKGLMAEFDAIAGEPPATSHASRDSRIVADALENLLPIARKCSTGYLIETIETNIAHLRRQAEEPTE